MEKSNNPYPPPMVMKLIRGFGWAFNKAVWQIRFRGVENIPPDTGRGLIIAPNHQTYLDPFWIIVPVNRRFRFIAWDKVFKIFGLGALIKYLGAFPVDITRGDKDAYQKAVEVLREGATLVIFPEASRGNPDGTILPFKSGAVRMAIEAGVPILPVTLRGAHRVWSQKMKLPRPFRPIEVIYHPALEMPPAQNGADAREHARALTDLLRQIIEQEL